MGDKQLEKSLVLIKPDGVSRGLVGEIIHRFERCGLKLVAMKMVIPSGEMVGRHYADDLEWKMNVGTKKIETMKSKGIDVSQSPMEIGDEVRQLLMKGLVIGPVVAMVWQGNNAIATIRKLVGATSPENSAPGTIRGDFAIDSYGLCDDSSRSMLNLIHASDAPETAEKEVAIWFTFEELYEYARNDDHILYSVN